MGRLHAAARDGQVEEAFRLIDSGLDVNEIDKLQYTPLHYAARKGLADVVQALIDHGANTGPVNDKGQTSLYQAVVGGHAAVAKILISHGADPDTPTRSGIRALHYAAREGREDMVQILLEGRASVTATNAQGITARDLAAQYKHDAIVALLDGVAASPPPESRRTPSTAAARVDRVVEAAAAGEMDEDEALLAELHASEIKVGDVTPVGVGQTASRAGGRVAQSTRRKTPLGSEGGGRSTRPESKLLAAELDALRPTEPGLSTSTPAHGQTPAPPPALPPRSKLLTLSENGEVRSVPHGTPAAGAASGEPDYASVSTLVVSTGENVAPQPNEPVYETQPPSFLRDRDLPSPRKGGGRLGLMKSTRPTPYRPAEAKADLQTASSVANPARANDVSLAVFLKGLGLLDRCSSLAEEAGIVQPGDFLLFTKDELVSDHKFKEGHVRKILKALGAGKQ